MSADNKAVCNHGRCTVALPLQHAANLPLYMMLTNYRRHIMSSTNRQSLIQRQKRARMNSLVDRMQEDAYAIHVVACQSVSQSINRSLLLSPTDEVSVILYALNGSVYNVSSNRDEVFKPSLTIRNSRHIVFATCVKLIYKQTATYLKLLYALVLFVVCLFTVILTFREV